jgi:hypothetical protein
VGAGLDIGYDPSERTRLLLTVDSVRRDFADRADLPNAGTLDGRLTSLRVRGFHELKTNHWVSGEYAMRRNSTGFEGYDFDSHELRASYALAYTSPVAGLGTWTSTLSAGVVRRNYDAADPAVVAGTVRTDTERRIGFQQTVGLVDQWSLVLSVDHVRLGSSLPNFRIRNTSVFAGVSRAF